LLSGGSDKVLFAIWANRNIVCKAIWCHRNADRL